MYASETERRSGQEGGGDAPTNSQATALIQGEENVIQTTTPQPHPPTTHPPNTQHDTQRSDIRELVDVFKSMLSQTNNSATKNNFFKAPSMSLSKVEDSGDHTDAITYHLWRKRLNQQMLTFGLTPEQVYNMLIDSSSKLLP